MHPNDFVANSPGAKSRRRIAGVGAVLVAWLLAANAALAQTAPDTDNGRFSLSPVPEGFLRMDTRTGAVSICSDKGGWACRLVPDERGALDQEIGRLQADNKKLREQAGPLTKEDSQKNAQIEPDKKLELQLPPEHEKLLALIDRVWDRLIDMAVRLQKRLSEKI